MKTFLNPPKLQNAMVQRIGSARRKSRSVMRKPLRERGKLAISKFFQKFKEGDRVVLKTEPAYQKGNFHRRFHGQAGIVQGAQGNCFLVQIKDGRKSKTIISHPVHLKRV